MQRDRLKMIVLIDATATSLTVSWPSVQGATRYLLQLRGPSSGEADDSFQTIYYNISGTQARKLDLQDEEGTGFTFRVRPVLPSDDEKDNEDEVNEECWISHPERFHLLTNDEDQGRMAKPQVLLEVTQSARVSWLPFDGAAGYELQMRVNIGGEVWQTVAPNIVHTQVRKKNLTSPDGYQFRVRPLVGNDSPLVSFSPPSDVSNAFGLADGIKNMFQGLEEGSLLGQEGTRIALADALGGKEFICLYASALWCGPCLQVTPGLAAWYQSISDSYGQSILEIVFLSCDHDEASFRSYFSAMPWLAVDFDDPTRERLLNFIRVSGIPHLAVIDGRTGRIIVHNTIGQGQTIDISLWRKLAQEKR